MERQWQRNEVVPSYGEAFMTMSLALIGVKRRLSSKCEEKQW